MFGKTDTNKYAILIGLLMLAVLGFGHFGFPTFHEVKAAEITPGTGVVVYGDGTEVSTGTFTTTDTGGASIGALSSISAGTISPFWTVVKGSPTNKELLAVSLDDTGTLQALRWDGTAWSLEWTESAVGSASLDTRAFDVAYEKSGEAVVAWARQKGNNATANPANDWEYRVWSGTSWAASSSFNITPTGASISWVQEWSHPASGSSQNEITACYATGKNASTSGTHVGCLVWDGSTNTWGNQKLVESNAEEEGSVLGSAKAFGGFYEQGSGDFIVVSSVDGSASPVLTTWTTSWTATAAFTWLDVPAYIECASMPYVIGGTNNRAVCGSFDSAAEDPDGVVWSGTAFGNTNAHDATSLTTSITGRKVMDSVWLVDGTTAVGTDTYGEAAAGVIANDRWDGVSAWAAADGPTPPGSTTHVGFTWAANPYQKNKATLLVHDSASDLHIYYASISGSTTINWGTTKTDVTSDMAGSAIGMPTDVAYFNYASPSQTHYRWYSDDAALGSATGISAEDIAASGSEDLTVNTTYRLRFQISNEGPASASNNKFRLEMVRKGASCSAPSAGWSWAPVPATATVASHAFDIEATSYFANNASVSAAALTASDPTFTNGYAMDTTATSGFQTLSGNNYTEFEYALKPNSNANTSADYCFRVGRLNGGSGTVPASASYTSYAEAGVQVTTTLAQNDYRWFANDNSVQPGSGFEAENTRGQILSTAQTTPVRLRANVNVTAGTLPANDLSLKLQYSTSTSGAASTDWCNISDDCTSSWANRRKIILNNTASAENLTNFPILVYFSSASFDFGRTQDSGQDIRFIDAGGTASLSYEIELWSESGKGAYVWVKVPQIDSASTADYIWMYYNNAGASDGQNVSGVWDSNYKGVWHLAESVTDEGTASDVHNDSTSNNNDGDQGGNDDTSGKIANAQDFVSDDFIDLGISNLPANNANQTIGFWAKYSSIPTSQSTFFAATDDSSSAINIGIGRSSNNAVQSDKWGGFALNSEPAPSVNTWHHITYTLLGSGPTNKIYFDGAEVDSTSTTPDSVTPSRASIARFNPSFPENFTGQIDELRVSATNRSADWIEADYNWTSAPATYSLLQAEETGLVWKNVGGETVSGDAWCSISNDCTSSWLNRRKITLNNAASAENLTNFPILVALSAASGSIDYADTQDSGQDIRFVDAGSTASLSYEIEDWNESGTSYVWVKVPQIDATSTTDYIWMYYNNISASDGQIASNTWNGAYRGVWHLDQNPAGTAPQMRDSTSRLSHGTSVGTMTSGDSVGGKVSNSLDFDGSDDGINSNAATHLDNLSKMTVTAWIYPRTVDGTERRIADKGEWHFNVHGTNRIGFTADFTPTQSLISNANDNSVTLNRWQHVALTWDGSLTSANADIYVNGVEVSYAARFDGDATRVSDAASNFFIGNRTDQALPFDGLIDEIRIASVSRSADWIEAEYNWSWEPWDYNTFGSEEILDAGPHDWNFYNNGAATDGATITANLLSVSDVLGRYAESNPTTATHNSVSSGQDIEFDFALDPSNAKTNVVYYFRVIKSTGTLLNTYNDFPSVIIVSPISHVPAAEGISGGGSMRTGGGQGDGGSGESEGGGSGGGSPAGGGGQSGGGGGSSPILWYILKWLGATLSATLFWLK